MTEQQIKRLQELLRKKESLENFIEYQAWGIAAMGQHPIIIVGAKNFKAAPNATIEDEELVNRFIALAETMLIEVKNEIAAL